MVGKGFKETIFRFVFELRYKNVYLASATAVKKNTGNISLLGF
jgi:hypothetical protein